MAALSVYGFGLGAMLTLIGAIGVHDIVYGEPIFGPQISHEGSVQTAGYGLGFGIPLMVISAIVFLKNPPRKD